MQIKESSSAGLFIPRSVLSIGLICVCSICILLISNLYVHAPHLHLSIILAMTGLSIISIGGIIVTYHYLRLRSEYTTTALDERCQILATDLESSRQQARLLSKDLQSARDMQELLETSFAALSEGVIVVDSYRTVIYRNDAHVRLLDRSGIGMPCHGLCGVSFDTCNECPLTLTLLDGNVHMREGLPCMSAGDGGTHASQEEAPLFEMTASAMLDTNGNITGAIAVVRDITGRRSIEAALRHSEQQYRSIVESQPEPVCRFSPEGVLSFVNEAHIRYFYGRQSREQIIGRSFFQMFSEEALTRLKDTLAALNEQSPVGSFEHMMVIPLSLEMRWLNWTIQLIEDSSGPGRQYQCIGKDITNRRTVEDALRASERQLAEAQRIAHIGSWQWNVESDTIRCSAEVYRILGLAHTETHLAYESLMSFLIKEDRALFTECIRESVIEQKPLSVDVRILRPNGSVATLHFMGELGQDGDADSMRGTVQDITARKKTERALKESEHRFRNIVEATDDGIWELNGNMIITYASDALSHILGYSTEEILGKTPFFFMPPVEAKRMMQSTARFFDLQEPFTYEFAVTHRSGHPVELEASCVPSFNAQGEFAGYRGIVRNITDEQELRRSLCRERKFNEALLSSDQVLLVLLDEGLHIRRVNEAFARQVGRAQKSLVSERFFSLFRQVQTSPALADLPAQSSPHASMTLRMESLGSPLAERRVWDVRAIRTADMEGEGAGLLLSMYDLTEMLRSEQELQQRIAQIEAAARQHGFVDAPQALCGACKSVRTAGDHWLTMEQFIEAHTAGSVPQSVCPECQRTLYPDDETPQERTIAPLSKRECEVLDWVSLGKSSWEISQLLGISEHTVKFHVSGILRKLDATSRSQAVAIALQMGMLNDKERQINTGNDPFANGSA